MLGRTAHVQHLATQVLALLTCPTLLKDPRVVDLFPADVVARAKKMMGSEFFPGGLGAYSDSRGAPGVRAEVADFITKRDGFPADPNVRATALLPRIIHRDPSMFS